MFLLIVATLILLTASQGFIKPMDKHCFRKNCGDLCGYIGSNHRRMCDWEGRCIGIGFGNFDDLLCTLENGYKIPTTCADHEDKKDGCERKKREDGREPYLTFCREALIWAQECQKSCEMCSKSKTIAVAFDYQYLSYDKETNGIMKFSDVKVRNTIKQIMQDFLHVSVDDSDIQITVNSQLFEDGMEGGIVHIVGGVTNAPTTQPTTAPTKRRRRSDVEVQIALTDTHDRVGKKKIPIIPGVTTINDYAVTIEIPSLIKDNFTEFLENKDEGFDFHFRRLICADCINKVPDMGGVIIPTVEVSNSCDPSKLDVEIENADVDCSDATESGQFCVIKTHNIGNSFKTYDCSAVAVKCVDGIYESHGNLNCVDPCKDLVCGDNCKRAGKPGYCDDHMNCDTGAKPEDGRLCHPELGIGCKGSPGVAHGIRFTGCYICYTGCPKVFVQENQWQLDPWFWWETTSQSKKGCESLRRHAFNKWCNTEGATKYVKTCKSFHDCLSGSYCDFNTGFCKDFPTRPPRVGISLVSNVPWKPTLLIIVLLNVLVMFYYFKRKPDFSPELYEPLEDI